MTNPHFAVAFALVTLGGLLTGAFAAPLKGMRRFKWENAWLAYSLFGLVVIPLAVIGNTVPHLGHLYWETPPARLLLVFGLGLLWGCGCATFGVGIDRLGMGLGFALIMGISTLLGTLAPLLLASGSRPQPYLFGAGLALLLAGIGICGHAGVGREKANRTPSAGRRGYTSGLVICAISGVLSSLFNTGMVAGKPIQEAASRAGAADWASGNAVWPLLLFGGFLANLSYCGYLLAKNGTIGLYLTAGWREWAGAFAMGAAWIGGVMMYGAGAFLMGGLGPILGWPMFTALMLFCAYLLGRLTGEWREAPPGVVRRMNLGVALNIASLFLIASSK